MPEIDLEPYEYHEKGRAPPKQPIFLKQSEPIIAPGGLINLALVIAAYCLIFGIANLVGFILSLIQG